MAFKSEERLYDKTPSERTPLMHEGKPVVTNEVILEISHRNVVLVASKRRKTVVLIACLVLQMLSFGLGSGLGVMYVELIRVFNSQRTYAAFVQSVYMGIMAGGGFLFTKSINTYGTGPCVIVGSVVACLGFVISSFAVNLPMVIILIGLLSGTGMCVCYLCSYVTVSWIFHTNPGVPLVFLTVGSSVGQLLLPYLYEIFISEFGWKGAFSLMGAITLNCLPIGILIHMSRKFCLTGSDTQSGKTTGLIDITLYKDPVIMLFVFNCLVFILTSMSEVWFIVDIMELRGYEREVGSFLLSVTGIGNFLGRGIGAFIRLYARVPTVYHWIYLCPVVAASHAMIIIFHDFWPLFVANLLYGISFGITVAQAPAIMFDIAGHARYPQAIALMNFTYGLGDLFGGVIGGLIKDSTGSYDLLFYIGVASALYISLGTVLIVYCMRISSRSKDNDQPYKKLPQEKHTDSIIDKKYLRLTNRRGTTVF